MFTDRQAVSYWITRLLKGVRPSPVGLGIKSKSSRVARDSGVLRTLGGDLIPDPKSSPTIILFQLNLIQLNSNPNLPLGCAQYASSEKFISMNKTTIHEKTDLSLIKETVATEQLRY